MSALQKCEADIHFIDESLKNIKSSVKTIH